MTRTSLLSLLLGLCAVLAVAQTGGAARVAILNYTPQAIDVRVGEPASPAMAMSGIAAGTVSQLTPARAGSFSIYYRVQGAAEWGVIRENADEGVVGGKRACELAQGAVYTLGVSAQDGLMGATLQQLTLPAGNKPKILFVATRMGPPRSASVLPIGAAPEAAVLAVDGITQYEVSGLHALPAAGMLGISFTWPAFYDTLTHFLPDPQDPSKPAVIDFRDGGVYAVVLAGFDENGVTASITTILPSTLSAPPAATAPPAPRPSPGPAPAGELTGVPASWNGNWALETQPARRALAIHDGKIYLVAGNLETETFPGTASRQYSFVYRPTEVATLLGGKLYERYSISPDASRITHIFEGRTEIYVRMRK